MIEYQKKFNKKLSASLRPYVVRDSNKRLHEINSEVNRSFYEMNGPDIKRKSQFNIISENLDNYQNFLCELKKIKNCRFMTCYKALRDNNLSSKTIILRHDIDGDIVTALEMAKLEYQLGIQSTYYILHSAPYYGSFVKHEGELIFFRNNKLISIILQIQDLGHEIGFHNDALGLYQNYNIDGARALETEINWLRSKKILINGTSAHNSFGVYGASNYSIFKNKPLSLDKPNEYKGVIKDKKWAPLGILHEKDLKLEYECNDFFWQKKKKIDFISLLRQGLWLYYKDHFNCLNKKKFSKEWCTYSMVIKNIESNKSKKLFYFLIHPMHYGFRFSKSSNPSKKFNIFHYLTGFKKERITNKEQNIIKEIFWKPNEFGNNERSLKKIKKYPKKVLFVYQDDFFIGSNKTLCDSKLSNLLTFLLTQEGETSVGAFSINIKNLKHLIKNHFEPSAIFFEVHKNSIVSNLSNEYLSKIKFKNIINLNKKKIIDSKVYNTRINKIINFNHKFDKYSNDYERHLFLCYEVIKVLKLQL